MTYGMELWRPAKNGAKITAVLTQAAKLISGIHGEASHTAFFKDRSVNQDARLAGLDILSAVASLPYGTHASICETGHLSGRRSNIRTQ